MSDGTGHVLKDKRGRLVCQSCGMNIARIWTSHRRTEIDHRISYQTGRPTFAELPRDGGVAAYCRDEYLCYNCCYSELESGENDESAVLDPGQKAPPSVPEERIELDATRAANSVEDRVGPYDAGDGAREVVLGEIRWGQPRGLAASGRTKN
jgi:hypothetical protein